MFDPSPGPGHVATYPATMPLAAAAFVAMLQLTLVGEGWPLRRLPRVTAGLAALAIAWAVALVMYFALADVRRELGAVLVLIGAWQVLFYVACGGWPFSAITTRSLRLPCAHVVIVGGGILTFLLAHDVLLGRHRSADRLRGVLRRRRAGVRHAARGLARAGRHAAGRAAFAAHPRRSRSTPPRTASGSRA